MEDMENMFTQGEDKNPENITEAYKLLTNWNQFVPPSRRSAPSEAAFKNVRTEELAYTTFTNIGQGRRALQPEIATIQCHNYNQMGHYSNE